MAMIAILLPVVAPIVICAGLGWGWARLGRPFDTNLVTALVTYIGAPCLVFTSLVGLTAGSEALARMGLAAVAALVAFALAGALALKLLRWPVSAFLAPLVFANTGNMGLPLALFAFGEAGLELAVVYFAVSVIAFMTLGIWLVSGQASPSNALKTPLPFAVAAALAFVLGGVEAPRWLTNTTGLLGQMTIPLMLITLGVSLARLQVARLGHSVVLAALRLGLGLAVGFGLAAAFGLEGPARGVFIIQSAMPVAVFNYLFAQAFQRHAEEVAGAIVVSTLVSFAALPFLVAALIAPP